MGDRRVAITHCRCSVTRFTGSDVLLFVSRGCARFAGLPLPSILRPLRGLSYAARLRSPSARQMPIWRVFIKSDAVPFFIPAAPGENFCFAERISPGAREFPLRGEKFPPEAGDL